MADKTSIFKINSLDSLESLNLKATTSNVYTKQEINHNAIIDDSALNSKVDKSDTYTRAEIITFIETQYTFNGSFIKIVDPATGEVRISLNSNIPITSRFTTRIDIQPSSQYGGSIRSIPALDTGDASIGYYNNMNTRSTSAGDVWICGVNCDNERGYTITTPVLNTCFNINLSGNVNIPYGLITPAITVNDISALTADYLTISDTVIIVGNTTIHKHCNTNNNLTVSGNSTLNHTMCIKNTGARWGKFTN